MQTFSAISEIQFFFHFPTTVSFNIIAVIVSSPLHKMTRSVHFCSYLQAAMSISFYQYVRSSFLR